MPWRLLVVCYLTGTAAGVVVGFVLGLHHPRTLMFAMGEGAFLVGVPATIVGLGTAAGVSAETPSPVSRPGQSAR